MRIIIPIALAALAAFVWWTFNTESDEVQAPESRTRSVANAESIVESRERRGLEQRGSVAQAEEAVRAPVEAVQAHEVSAEPARVERRVVSVSNSQLRVNEALPATELRRERQIQVVDESLDRLEEEIALAETQGLDTRIRHLEEAKARLTERRRLLEESLDEVSAEIGR